MFEQDVLHCHLTYGAVFGTLVQFWRWVMREPKPVVVETYHAVGMAIPALHRRIHALLASKRDALALMAEDSYWRAFRAAHPQLPSRIIPNGIAVVTPDAARQGERGQYRAGLGIPADCTLVVGTVGMLRPDRKPWLYIPIFARIAREFGPGVHFVVAGGGPEMERMQSLVAESGFPDRIHLIGLVIEPQNVLDIVDLYLTLNVGPNSGLAGLEAALSGLPVIAVQMSADYVAGGSDWIWSDSDPAKVAARAVELLRSAPDRKALANRQSVYARAHHGVESMARAYHELYLEATQRLRNRAEQ